VSSPHKLLWMTCALLGCRASAPVRDRPALPVACALEQSAEVIAPPPLLAQRVEAIVRGTAPAGARFVRYVSTGFLTERQSITHAMDLPPGCVSIVAYGSPGIGDLDARVYDANGELLVEDLEPDAHPTVQLCADEGRRVFHGLQSFEGEGAYALAMFAGDRRAMEAISRAVGGRPGTALTSRTADGDVERRASELRASVGRRGFVPSMDPVRVSFAQRGAVSVPIQVAADRCYTLGAMVDGASLRGALRVFDADGVLLAYDTRSERDPTVQLCPSTAGVLRAELRGSDAGSAVVLAFAADAASFGGANTLWLGERTSIALSPMSVAERVAALRSHWTAAGFEARGEPSTTVFAQAESRESSLTIEPGRCVLVASVAGRGVGRVELSLFDEQGSLLARGLGSDGVSLASVCGSSARERVVVRQRVEVGGGEVGLWTALGGPLPSWAAGLDRPVISEALVRGLGQERGWRLRGEPERIRVGAGAARSRELELTAGVCARTVVLVGGDAPSLSIVLRGPTGAELARGSGAGSARWTHYAGLPTRGRVEVELDEPSAPERDAVLLRFERPEADGGGPGAEGSP
jgi:hypothetical protein